ncbi:MULTISPECIES: RNA 2'-phosphotransferase [Myroides]|uniref:Probable RNA 2'-phosphotransferase n=1 Tax=Myroides albus TaxID=2562892 RepID=A0A6I3LP91_9FLAO|nr:MULTISPECIES: RNA 2'-phosphotransferase [Myroides]MTG99140.1 RNA 2'-phosphotransferase [Myroides albus]MVX36776.1 RNA 2'-phosphotransferase [Myroides sp. LoEW2-1]UVD79899.1 RNA 2'-phosphotransferase [Myroides albus]
MDEKKKKAIGKFISLILRHEPSQIGIVLDNEGWANVEELIAKSAMKGVCFSKEELDEIVSTNDKKRYTYNEDGLKIRANQGHSLNVDLGLVEKEPPMFLYHGTSERFVQSILNTGISKMQRQHVHLSKDKETAIQVGSRRGKAKVFTVLAGQMYQDGFKFYQSENGVWLTDIVDKKYLSK